LFFREFDIPLKEIKSVMDNPALDKKQILKMQRSMLLEKKERLEHLIESIDDILKGEQQMNQEICNQTDFSKTNFVQKTFTPKDIEDLYESIMSNMPREQRHDFMKAFIEASAQLSVEEKQKLLKNCSEETFHRLFVRGASGERVQKNFQKMVEWYGDKKIPLRLGPPPPTRRFSRHIKTAWTTS
jgi:DNA-binding transcriptional MerR regulator